MFGKQVLHIGPQYNPPQGGIAQALYNYEHCIFHDDFHFLANSCSGSKLKKAFFLPTAISHLLITLLTCRDIKIVHIHTASKMSFVRSVWFMKISKLFGKKVIMHIHGGGFKNYYDDGHRSFVTKNLNQCDLVIALSDAWKLAFERDLALQHVCVLENLVPPPVSAKMTDDGKLHILFLGLLTKEKGLYDLIEAIREGHDRWCGKLVLHVGGKGDTQAFLHAIKGLEDTVSFEGWVSGDKKNELLNQCKVFVLPSYTEGLPISILESMSYGMAIVATPVGAIPSIVNDGENGLIVPTGSPKSIEKTLDLLLKSPCMVSKMGEQSKLLVEPFLPTNVEKKLAHIYAVIDEIQ